MLGVTEKSFDHLSGRYDVAGRHHWQMIDRIFAHAGPAIVFMPPPTLTHWLLLDRAVS